jgi:hypothetical protein
MQAYFHPRLFHSSLSLRRYSHAAVTTTGDRVYLALRELHPNARVSHE